MTVEDKGGSGTDAAETAEALKKELEEAKAEADKWKALSRKNEDDKKANSTAAKERDELKKQLDALESTKLSEAEKAEKRMRELEASIKAERESREAAEKSALRARIGAEKKLPAQLISRLVGDDEETIAADADALLAAIPDEVKQVWPELGQGEGGDSTITDPLLKDVIDKVGG